MSTAKDSRRKVRSSDSEFSSSLQALKLHGSKQIADIAIMIAINDG